MWVRSRTSAARVDIPSAALPLPSLDEHVHCPALVVGEAHRVQLTCGKGVRLDELDGGRISTGSAPVASGGGPATSTRLTTVVWRRRSLDQVGHHSISHSRIGQSTHLLRETSTPSVPPSPQALRRCGWSCDSPSDHHCRLRGDRSGAG
jgi:hypothetical protein